MKSLFRSLAFALIAGGSLAALPARAADIDLAPGDAFFFGQTLDGRSLLFSPLQSGVVYQLFAVPKSCCDVDHVVALVAGPGDDPVSTTIEAGEEIYVVTMQTGETIYIASLSGVLYTERQIGIMADRILEMARYIGWMADRIVETEQLIVETEYLLVDAIAFTQQNLLTFASMLVPWRLP